MICHGAKRMVSVNRQMPRSEVLLLPMSRFAHPNLNRRPAYMSEKLADDNMSLMLGKACAGLSRDLRVDGAWMRRAFMSGRFDRQARSSWEWAWSGLPECVTPHLHALCALTIRELAWGMREVFGEDAGGLAHYLNQWGENPHKPLPTGEGVCILVKSIDDVPPPALAMRPDHPNRTDVEGGLTILELNDVKYGIETLVLNEHQDRYR